MGADEQGLPGRGGVHRLQVGLAEGHEPAPLEPGEFLLIVDDGTERKQVSLGVEDFLGRADGADHAAAETGMGIDLDLHHHHTIASGASSNPNLPRIRPSAQAISSVKPISELSSTKASSARRSGEVSRWESM